MVKELKDKQNTYSEKFLKYNNFNIYAGLQWIKARNIKIDVEGYKKIKGRNDYILFGMDIILGRGVFTNKIGEKTKDIEVLDENNNTYYLKDVIKYSSGYRLLWQYYRANIGKPISFSFRMNFGMWPAPVSNKIDVGLFGKSENNFLRIFTILYGCYNGYNILINV